MTPSIVAALAAEPNVTRDRGVRYDAVVFAMDLARSAGVRVVGVALKGIANGR